MKTSGTVGATLDGGAHRGLRRPALDLDVDRVGVEVPGVDRGPERPLHVARPDHPEGELAPAAPSCSASASAAPGPASRHCDEFLRLLGRSSSSSTTHSDTTSCRNGLPGRTTTASNVIRSASHYLQGSLLERSPSSG